MVENHILIGLGGTGGKILKAFRKRYFLEYSKESRKTTPWGFVYVDSSDELMKPNDISWKVLGEDAQLGQEHFVFIKGADLGSQLDNVNSFPGIKQWIGDRKLWNNLVGSYGSDGAAAQKRRLGRFLFACNVNKYESVLKNQVAYSKSVSGYENTTFHIVTGLAGGTGSGSIVDVIAQTRKYYTDNTKFKIMIYLLVPEQSPLPGWDAGFYHANGYAALQELNALHTKNFGQINGKTTPHDISGEFERVPIENVDRIFNGGFLFTNVNENGVAVDTNKDLPDIVSDFLHHIINIKPTGNDEIDRKIKDPITFENIDQFEKELNEKAKTPESAFPVRTRRFGSFGIKRIIHPEEEITEYISYSFSRQSLLQLKYNNWNDDFGFSDEPKNEDYHAVVNDKANQTAWMLTDDHLMLNLPILESDKEQRWKKIKDDWDGIIPQLADAAWEKGEAEAARELGLLCDLRFDQRFRNHGVVKFYADKLKAKKDITREIVKQIEKSIYADWSTGQKSTHDLIRMMDTLINHTESRIKDINAKVSKKNEEVEQLQVMKSQSELKYKDVGLLSKVFGGKKNAYEEHCVLLKTLYTKKTELEALRFASKLIVEIIQEMQILSGTIREFNDTLASSISNSEKLIASRCKDGKMTTQSFNESIVKYYDSEDVRQFTQKVIRNQDIQKNQTANLRKSITSLAGSEPSFSKLLENVNPDRLLEIFDTESRESAVAAHNELNVSKKDKLIGVNIIEKLYEQYGGQEKQAELNDFARNIIQKSGIYLNFDKTEVLRNLPNQSATPKKGLSVLKSSVIVSIPPCPELKGFIDDLKDAFKRNVSGDIVVAFDELSTKMNEITALSVTYCFSLRMVEHMKFLKQKYELKLNEQNAAFNKLVLHLDGDGTQYPKIVLESSTAGRNKYISDNIGKSILAIGMDIIKHQSREDGTGRNAYSIIETNEYGMPMPPTIMSETVVGMIEYLGQDFDNGENFAEKILPKIDNKLKGDFLHIEKRKELITLISGNIIPKVMNECNGNASDNSYKMIYDALMLEFKGIMNN